METTPLLAESDTNWSSTQGNNNADYIAQSDTEPEPELNPDPETPGASSPQPEQRPRQNPTAVVTLICAIIFCFALLSSLADVPMTRILEDRLCRRYYGRDGDGNGDGDGNVLEERKPVDEEMCKVGTIQTELAYLNGFLSTLDAVVGALISFVLLFVRLFEVGRAAGVEVCLW